MFDLTWRLHQIYRTFSYQNKKKIVFQSSFNLENSYPVMKRVGCFFPLREICGISESNRQALLTICAQILLTINFLEKRKTVFMADRVKWCECEGHISSMANASTAPGIVFISLTVIYLF